jgi:hypothetical protein
MKKTRNSRPKGRHARQLGSRSRGSGLEIVQHPMSSIDPAALRAALLKLARDKVLEFPQLLAKIDALFRAKFPPSVLATLAGYGLRAGVSADGVASETMISNLQQHHVELLHALALTLPSEEWGIEPAVPNDIQQAIDTVIALTDAFHQRRFLAIEETEGIQERVVLALREKLRMHTQVVRNWGYFSDVVRISGELYAPLDVQLRQHHGFGSSDLITVGRTLVSILEARFNERYGILRKIFRERSIPRLVRQYYKHYPNVEGDREEFLRNVPSFATIKMVRARLLGHADMSLVPEGSVTVSAIADHAGLPTEVAGKVLDALSLEPGALKGSEREHLFLSNPIWVAPIIRMGDQYFCPAPQVLFSHIHDVLHSLAEAANLKTVLENRRADYLETKIGTLLKSALPDSVQWPNAKWRVAGVEYETDRVAKLDKTIVIVEAKSAALTAPGLRGAPDRVKRHVRDLILDPSEQSARLEALIRQARTGDREAVAALADFGDGFADTDAVLRISVTLDDFSILSSSELELKEAGWIPQDVELPCTLNVADLECAIEILADPARFVHYFAERQRFQKSLHVLADEMDFLGFYLQTGFNVWSIEGRDDVRLSISGVSGAIDHYYNSRDAGVSVPKPKPKILPYFAKLIEAIAARKSPGWLGITLDLLRMASYDEQKSLEKAFDKLKRNVERYWRNPEHECSVMVIPPPIRETTVVFYAYPPQLESKRKEIAEELIAKALEKSGRSRCLLIGRNISKWNEAYSFIYTARRPKSWDDTPPYHVPDPSADSGRTS